MPFTLVTPPFPLMSFMKNCSLLKPICKKRSLIRLISQPLLIPLTAPLPAPVPLGGVPLRPLPNHPILAPQILGGIYLLPTPGSLLQARISLVVIDHHHDHILATVRFVVFRVILQNGALRFTLYRMIRPPHHAVYPLVLLLRGNLGLILRPPQPPPLHPGSLIVGSFFTIQASEEREETRTRTEKVLVSGFVSPLIEQKGLQGP
ncbi:hypothetical protein F0562_030770 [Nyssa sinensis]|uniref:Uncharacterized protein n=1 Tax=Nyssa sinensis TaxID=561372 RepID=A0A5J5AZM9_9ASTE|nr:hypothetical protein F0562_030770 [Nyssa sinensis]